MNNISLSTLNKGLINYAHKEAAKSDIEKAAIHYNSLNVKIQPHTFDNGNTSNLLSLDGTLPVVYSGQTYNIPIVIYFLRNHPYDPPIVYVRPTANMEIKSSPHVDTSGLIYLSYLNEWKKCPTANTQTLMSILQDTFGKRPPVYAKQNTHYPPNRPPPIGFDIMPNASPNGSQYPYPGAAWTSSGPNMPVLQNSTLAYGMPGIPQPESYPAPSIYGPSSDADPLVSSLRTAVYEELTKRHMKTVNLLTAEIQSLETTSHELDKRKEQLDIYQAKMSSEIVQVNSIIRELQSKTAEYKSTYKKLNSGTQGNASIDSTVDTTTPLYRQLFKAFTEEQAIDDILYNLVEAVGEKAISVESFLSMIQKLSRQQFMLRATVLKCRERAGLPTL